jgi:precorrin-6A/cobalt-precorrin-6A reductase
MKVLILGGTGEARELAAALAMRGHEVTTSLAGRTSEPLMPAGAVRVGGFGGAEGLAAYLRAMGVERLVDATHPYAEEISANAVAATAPTGVPLVRLMRAPWVEPAGTRWRHVGSIEAAAAALPSGARVLVTSGHEGLGALLARDDCRFEVRLIEPPEGTLPGHAVLLLARPPYDVAGERELMRREGITHLVSKNSGGAQTAAKLEAAWALGVEVVMVDRPGYPAAVEVGSVAEAVEQVERLG